MGALTARELTSKSLLIQLLMSFGCTYSQRAYIRECAYTTSEGFWVHLQPESLHPRVCLYIFYLVLGSLTARELTSESVLIQLLISFGFTYSWRVYIRECAYTTSEGFWVQLQPESLHPRVCLYIF